MKKFSCSRFRRAEGCGTAAGEDDGAAEVDYDALKNSTRRDCQPSAMIPKIIFALTLFTPFASFGQGTVTFANPNPNAPITNSLTLQRVVAGTTFLAQLYYAPDSPTAPDDGQMISVGSPVGFFTPGFFNGGTVTVPVSPAGSRCWLQVRVWESAYGSSYEEALHSPPQNDRCALIAPNATVGCGSPIFRVDTADPTTMPPETPVPLNGMRGFSVCTGATCTGPTSYSIRLRLNGLGTVSRNPSQVSYLPGTNVRLTAIPADNWRFIAWSEDVTGSDNPVDVIMTGEKSITANFSPCRPPNMVAWWNADGNAGDFIGDSDGTLNNGTTYAPGKVGQAFSFDGTNDYVNVPDTPALGITDQITIEAWVNPNRTYPGAILTKVSGPIDSSYLLDTSMSGQLLFEVDNYSAQQSRWATSVGTLPVNQWSHVAATFNPATQAMKLYINGVEASATLSGTAVSSIYDGISPVIIGAYSFGFGFSGLIDEVSLYNRELSASEIQDIYNVGSQGKCGVPQTKTLTTSVTGSGSVARNPNLPSYPKSSTVTLTATPASGWFFDTWTGDASGADNPLSVQMTSNKTIVAQFHTNFILTTSVTGAGSVTRNPNLPSYPRNATVLLTAVPVPGWYLANWSGDASGADNPLSVQITSDKTIGAEFRRDYGFPLPAYLKASNTDSNDFFGTAVAISGDTVVVGADFEDSNATGVNGNQADNSVTNSGAAYVFARSGKSWKQQAYLKASNTGVQRLGFGYSVAISGDTIVVGARGDSSSATGVNGNQNDNNVPFSGAAYVFVRNGTNWTQQAYLKASNTGSNDFFGASVGVSSNTIVVGAYGESSSATGVNGNQADNSAANSGAVYVFVRSGTNWTQQAYLKASNTGSNDFFGLAAAISGDTIVVGAQSEDSNATGVNGNQNDNSASSSGAAYVFTRSGTTWSQQAYLKASNAGGGDTFGIAVAVSKETVVVGAYGEGSNATGVNGNQNDNSAGSSGAAYVFVRSGTNWTQQAYLKASNTGSRDFFGVGVAVSDDTVVVGANDESSNATQVNGNQADNSATNSGAAYVFVRSGTNWTQLAYLKAFNSETYDFFGRRVALSGGTVVIGANSEDSNATGVNGTGTDPDVFFDSGAAYIFNLNSRVGIVGDGAGGYFIGLTGLPQLIYRLERAANPSGPWTTIATLTIPSSGQIEFHDTPPPPGRAFYRAAQP